MKKLVLFLVLAVFAVLAATKTTSQYGSELLTRPMSFEDVKYEHYTKFNKVVDDLDTLFDLTTGVSSTTIAKTSADVDVIDADTVRFGSEYSLVKTRKHTFTTVGSFDTSEANVTAQNLKVDSLIMPYARILDVLVLCRDSVKAIADSALVGIAFTVGSASAGNQHIASTTVDETGEVASIAAGAMPTAVISADTTAVWVGATPAANWNTLWSGEWDIYITYIDHEEF